MKTLKFYLFVVLSAFLVSCSGSGTLSPVSKKIQGPLGDYFEIVEREYKVNDENQVTIEIKRIKDGFPSPWVEGVKVGLDGGDCAPNFSVDFVDGDGNIVCSDATDIVDDFDVLKKIESIKIGETATISFVCNEKGAKQLKMSSTFDVYPDYLNVSPTEDSGSSIDESSSSNSTESSEDWDALLDSYEDYVDSYISLLKKANAGDLDALSEYPSLLQKAQEMGEKMSNASGDLSVSQLNRYNQINQKMLNAAQEMK